MALDSFYKKIERNRNIEKSRINQEFKSLKDIEIERAEIEEVKKIVQSLEEGQRLLKEQEEKQKMLKDQEEKQKKSNFDVHPIDMPTNLEGNEIIYDNNIQKQDINNNALKDIDIDTIDENSALITYHLPDGTSQVEVCPTHLNKYEKEILNKFLNDKNYINEVIKIHPMPNSLFKGYIEKNNINSSSCCDFYKRYFDFITVLMKEKEILKVNYYKTKDKAKLEKIVEYDRIIQLLIHYNKNNIVPIWNGVATVNGEKYQGANVHTIFEGKVALLGESWERIAASERICFNLVTGCNISENDVDKYGINIKEDIILALYGSKALNKYKDKVKNNKDDKNISSEEKVKAEEAKNEADRKLDEIITQGLESNDIQKNNSFTEQQLADIDEWKDVISSWQKILRNLYGESDENLIHKIICGLITDQEYNQLPEDMVDYVKSFEEVLKEYDEWVSTNNLNLDRDFIINEALNFNLEGQTR